MSGRVEVELGIPRSTPACLTGSCRSRLCMWWECREPALRRSSGLFVIYPEGSCLLFENTGEWVEMRVRVSSTVIIGKGVRLDSSFDYSLEDS